tara:strand:+ start:11217 stop:12044 length:828 start_codon:yes stop_codon:yes gene_type:complete
LNRFKDLEWSGPAWYKLKKDEDGYPIEFRIVHFHPLNLGGHASTEWTAGDFAKIMQETYESKPSLKTASIGLIHSHNTMGAFFSATDTSTMEDNAPEKGFYASLVVAKTGNALHAFGFGYQDQYKVQHCVEIDEDDIEICVPGYRPLDKWVDEADIIEKNKPKVKPGNQMTLYDTVNHWRPLSKTQIDNLKKNKTVDIDVVGKTPKEKVLESKTSSCQKLVKEATDRWIEGNMSDVDYETFLSEKGGFSYGEIILLMGNEETTGYGGSYGYHNFC